MIARHLRVRASALALGVAASLMLGGCSMWGGTNQAKPLELGPMEPVLEVRQAWRAQVGEVGVLPLTVQVQGDSVLLASLDGQVTALDARTGQTQWRVALGEPLLAGVGSDGRHTAVVTQGNALVGLAQGRELWRQNLTAQAYTAPLVAGERVFVQAADRSLAAFDAATGKRLWRQSYQAR